MTQNAETQTTEQLDQIPDNQNNSEITQEEDQEQKEQVESDNNINENNEIKVDSSTRQKTKKTSKRPPNSYVLFCSDHRKEVLEQNPTFSAMEVSQTLSKMWKELDPAQVNEYKDRAKNLFDNYKQENPQYHYKMNSKSSKKTTVRINQKDAFQIINHLFQTSPFLLQQMLLEKDKKGHLDITRMFSVE